jgi:hypothetical protein
MVVPKMKVEVPMAQATTQNGSVRTEYIVVKTEPETPKQDDKKEGKAVMKDSISRVMGMMRGKNGKVTTIRTRLVDPIGVTGTANTAYTTVLALTSGNWLEFSSFAALFDEYRVTHFELYWRVVGTATAGAGVSVQASAIWMFDPTSNTVLTGVGQGMESDQNTGPHVVMDSCCRDPAASGSVGGINQNQTSSPIVQVSKNGFWQKKFKVPSGTQLNPGTSGLIVNGAWTSTQDATVVHGYLKPYIEAMGTNIIPNVYGFIVATVEFRSRR